MARPRSRRVATVLAAILGAGVAACAGGGKGAPGDDVLDVPVVIRPDTGPKDPGRDPTAETVTPEDTGTEAKDPGAWDLGGDPGIEDPGYEDPGTWDPGWDPGVEDPGTTDPGCTATCGTKECGTVCGKSCGACVQKHGAGWACVAFQCQSTCTPDCTLSTCGDDKCGGTCGTEPCPADRPCTINTNGNRCASVGPCKKTTTLACADLSVSAGNGTGNSDVLDIWSEACGSTQADGPEKVFRFAADGTGSVTLTLTGQPSWLDLYLIEGGTCGTTGCTQRSHDSITFDAVSGTTYWIVADATVNNSTMASLAIDCSWYVPPAADP